nr:tetratricopeptide repeat protein [Epibacterium ulvae]
MLRNDDLDGAEVAMKAAEKLVPDSLVVKELLANLYFKRGRYDQALVPLMQILAKDPNNSAVYSTFGAILQKMGDHAGAKKLFKKALQCDPSNRTAQAHILDHALKSCDWSDWDETADFEGISEKTDGSFSVGLFLRMLDNPDLQKKRSEIYYDDKFGDLKQARPTPRVRGAGDKIRLGYFSSDIHFHPTMWLMNGMLEHHDRDKFEISIYDYSIMPDAMTERVKGMVDHYHRCTDMTDDEVVALARADGIDIAIDLKGHTENSRVGLILKNPAPVNMSYIGYPGTLGSKDIDYIVADEVVIPAEHRKHYNEKIIYMPDCYQVTDDKRPIPAEKPSRAELGLPEDALVLCSFNATHKITPDAFSIWMRVLKQVDNSVLWIYSKSGKIRENLRLAAAERGVSPDRLIFAATVSQEQHLARIAQADLFVDTFAYCAHTTASDAIWAGIPLVTMEGQQFSARVASSILQASELPELVTRSKDEYEALILELAQNPDKLAAVRAKVEDKRYNSAMFATERFTRNWEKLMERALVRCENGLKPAHLKL